MAGVDGPCSKYEWCEGHGANGELFPDWHTGWTYTAQAGGSEITVNGSVKDGVVDFNFDTEWEIAGDELEKEIGDLTSIFNQIFEHLRQFKTEVTA